MNTQTSTDHRPAIPVTHGSAIHVGTLLLVEDSRLASDVVRLMFQGAGARLRRTETVAGAMRHLELYTPDAAMIDLGLPDGSGLDLIARIAERRPRVPLIIAMSGQVDMGGAALTAGADIFLPKPLESVALFRQVLSKVFFPFRLSATVPDTLPTDSAALRDDLYMALDLLCGARTDAHSHYALQFIDGLAMLLPDAALADAVAQVRAGAARTGLITRLRQHMHCQPLV